MRSSSFMTQYKSFNHQFSLIHAFRLLYVRAYSFLTLCVVAVASLPLSAQSSVLFYSTVYIIIFLNRMAVRTHWKTWSIDVAPYIMCTTDEDSIYQNLKKKETNNKSSHTRECEKLKRKKWKQEDDVLKKKKTVSSLLIWTFHSNWMNGRKRPNDRCAVFVCSYWVCLWFVFFLSLLYGKETE